jgi:hypothetical protein
MRFIGVIAVLIVAHLGGCARHLSFQVVDAQTLQPLDQVAVHEYVGPGDPTRAAPIGVAATAPDGKFEVDLEDGVVNTFEFRRPGYKTMIARTEYDFSHVIVWCQEGPAGQYTKVGRTQRVAIPMPRVVTSRPAGAP